MGPTLSGSVPSAMTRDSRLRISRLEATSDAESCAHLMATSEPWLTLGRTYEASLRIVQDPTREVYLARDEEGLAGFLFLCMTGAFVGYLQTILVHSDRRGQGMGSRLLEFAEQRILKESPNVGARRLYERQGYEVVGELTDYIVDGYSEILLRKTRGPLTRFTRLAEAPDPGKAS
jgi:ribosomal-protein-alanine N-acetyltransferase